MITSQLKDSFNFVKRLTWQRTWNIIKVISSYYLSRITRKPYHFGLPISISVEPTTSCNLRCPECPSGLRQFSRPTGMLTPDTFNHIIDQVYKQCMYLILYFQGEPYLNKSFFDFVKKAESRGIYTATSTNAHYLHDINAKKTVESGLSRLIISIDGATQETYQSYRIGGKIDKVLDGARNVVKWRKKLGVKHPHIIFQFLVVRPNEHEIEDIKKIADEIGIDEVRFKTAQVYEYEHGNPLIPEQEKYARYKQQEDGTYKIKNKLLNHCWRLWHSCVFTWDGKIVPCCFDKDATHQMGDLKQHGFRDIWQGDQYQNFRSAVLRSRNSIDICTNCTEGTKIWN